MGNIQTGIITREYDGNSRTIYDHSNVERLKDNKLVNIGKESTQNFMNTKTIESRMNGALKYIPKNEITGKYKWPEFILDTVPNHEAFNNCYRNMNSFKAKELDYESQTNSSNGEIYGQMEKGRHYNNCNSNTQKCLNQAFSNNKSLEKLKPSLDISTKGSILNLCGKSSTNILSETKFDTKFFCTLISSGEAGVILKRNTDESYDIQLQSGEIKAVNADEIKITRIISVPNLQDKQELLTQAARNHHLNLIASKLLSMRSSKGIFGTVKPPLEIEKKLVITKPSTWKITSKNTSEQCSSPDRRIHPNGNQSVENAKTDFSPNRIVNLNFGPDSYNTFNKLKTLKGSENIPSNDEILLTNFLRHNKFAYPMPYFISTCEIKTVENSLYVDKVNDFKVLSQSLGCQPIFPSNANDPNIVDGHTLSTSVNLNKQSQILKDDKEQTSSINEECSRPMIVTSTEEYINAPGILRNNDFAGLSAKQYGQELSELSSQLGWVADWQTLEKTSNRQDYPKSISELLQNQLFDDIRCVPDRKVGHVYRDTMLDLQYCVPIPTTQN